MSFPETKHSGLRLVRVMYDAPNKSLDASGGSVFRIMIGPAMRS
jgi:hypothetical protein